jgi:hypothetical protein
LDSKKAGLTIVIVGIVLTLIAVVIGVNRIPEGGITTSSGSDKIAVIHLTGTIAFSQGSSLLDASSSSAGKVVVDSLSGSWFQRTFIHGTRVL